MGRHEAQNDPPHLPLLKARATLQGMKRRSLFKSILAAPLAALGLSKSEATLEEQTDAFLQSAIDQGKVPRTFAWHNDTNTGEIWNDDMVIGTALNDAEPGKTVRFIKWDHGQGYLTMRSELK